MKIRILAFILIVLAIQVAPARRPSPGYRGFLEWSNSVRSQVLFLDGKREPTFYTGFSTTHGYQISPLVFVGAGLDFEYCKKISSTICAFYLQGKADMQFGKFSPFGELRLGYNVARGGGIYISPSIGYRFNCGRKVGVNIGAGLTVQGYKYDIYNFYLGDDDNIVNWGYIEKIGTKNCATLFFSFRVGIDF